MKKLILYILFATLKIYAGYTITYQSKIYTNEICPTNYTPSQRSEWVVQRHKSIGDYIQTYVNTGSVCGSDRGLLISWQIDNRQQNLYLQVDFQAMCTEPGTTDSLKCVYIKSVQPFYTQNNIEYTSYVYYPHIANCSGGYDTNMVTINSVTCYELGDENPAKPKFGNYPTINGKWVALIYNCTRSGITFDSTYITVVSGGCSGVTFNGDRLKSGNSKDTCYLDTIDMVPQTFCNCLYAGQVLSGTCAQNGLDTSCGGQTPFNYTSRNDSILNECKFGKPELIKDSIDTLNTIENDSSRNLSEDLFKYGVNKIIGNQSEQIKETQRTNGFLGTILSTLSSWYKDWNENSKKVNTKLDSLYSGGLGSDSILTSLEGLGVDTSGSGITEYDTSGILSGIKNKYRIGDTSLSSDTNITPVDSEKISSLFEQFRIDQDTTCDCDSDWFVMELMDMDVSLNLCDYPLVATITKLLLNTLVVFTLGWVSMQLVFRLLNQTFD